MTKKVSASVYKSIVILYIYYCDVVYAQADRTSLEKGQSVQNRAIRLCLNIPPRSHVADIHKEINLVIWRIKIRMPAGALLEKK